MTIIKFKKLLYTFYFLSIIAMFALIVKGQWDGYLLFQSSDNRSLAVGTPFESSGSTSRYALTEAIAEDNTLLFNDERAKFASPDIVKSSRGYLSIFTPGVSYVGVPFYQLGAKLGFPQIATYLTTALFALFNAFLVSRVTNKLGGGHLLSIISGLLFLFATNALPYALTLTQHHASTFFILLGILNAVGPRNLLNNIIFGIIYGAGLLMDIPSGIIMLPLLIYIIAKQFELTNTANKLKLSIKLNFIGLIFGIIPLVGFFGWYNYQTTGSYTTLSQFLGRSTDFTNNLQTEITSTGEKKGIELPFQTRGQIEGFYIFLVSDQRSIFVYSPIVLIGILGLIIAYKQKSTRNITVLLIAVILTNFITYTMFGDPTGSWAFGPRYLIAAIAVLCSGIGIALNRYNNKTWFIFIFFILTIYSISVNTLGAMTTIQIPPKVEAVNLPEPVPYTYEYNWQLLTEKGINSSLIYNLYANKYVSSLQYSALYAGVALFLISITYLAIIFEKRNQ